MKKIDWKRSIWLGAALVLLLVDVLVKTWASRSLKPIGELPIWDGVIGFRYAENTGAAFSALSGATGLLSAVSLIVCLAVAGVLMCWRDSSRMMNLCLTLILAGGVGNLIDRMRLGYVVDMFEFQFMQFAVFNVADVYITVGAALLFLVLMLGGDKHERVEN